MNIRVDPGRVLVLIQARWGKIDLPKPLGLGRAVYKSELVYCFDRPYREAALVMIIGAAGLGANEIGKRILECA